MTNTHTRNITVGILSLAIFALVVTMPGGFPMPPSPAVTASLVRERVARRVKTPAVEEHAAPVDHRFVRQAERLSGRLAKHDVRGPTVEILAKALGERAHLLSLTATGTFASSDTELAPWSIAVSANPLWIHSTFSRKSASFVLDPALVAESLALYPPVPLSLPVATTLLQYAPDEDGVLRAQTEGIAREGRMLDPEEAAEAIVRALLTGEEEVVLNVYTVPGALVNAAGPSLGTFSLLATGRSNFAGSGVGRIKNVHKGFEERVTNILVPPGETFSFNATLGNMSLGNGWHLALGIFNGNELRPVPGGGICQVATTVYRAIVNAGFPIVKRKNHSLYVSYYEKYGVGIDATIFPGKQDLAFVNDTGHYLFIQSRIEGTDAIVSFYGTPDGRTVNLNGPFFASNAPSSLRVNDRPLRKSEIAYEQVIHFPDGTEQRNILVSAYNAVPKSIVAKYTLVETVHAAAD